MEFQVLTGKRPVHRQAGHSDRHQQLVGHRVNDGAHYRLQLISPGDVAVHQIGDTGIGEERERGCVVIVDQEIPNQGCRD